MVPLVFQNHSYGVLVAIDRLHDGPEFTTDDERLLEAFAASAATAVATAQSVASERQRQRLAAAEAERQRWARELHDDTLQSLSALRVGLSTAKRSGKPEALEQAVTSAIDHLEEGITNLRALITDLRPASLDELGAAAAIQALGERAERHGIDVDVSIELPSSRSEARHSPEIETAMYRIVQEALTNAAKHGNAKRAIVEVHEDDADIRVSVRDDGERLRPLRAHRRLRAARDARARTAARRDARRSTPRPARDDDQGELPESGAVPQRRKPIAGHEQLRALASPATQPPATDHAATHARADPRISRPPRFSRRTLRRSRTGSGPAASARPSACARPTSTMSGPCNATIRPKRPAAAASIAATPKRVASTRS